MVTPQLGLVLVTHLGIGREMRRAVEEILKEETSISVVEVDSQRSLTEAHDRIADAVHQFKAQEGVLILTDIFGATPTNLCKDMLAGGRVAVVTGINLPMVLKAATAKFEKGASEAAEFLRKYGSDNIRIFS